MRRLFVLVVVALAVTACGASGQPKDAAATPETAAAPSGHPPDVGRSAAWLHYLHMVSPTSGWALVWSSNPAGRGNAVLEPAVTHDEGHSWVPVTPAAARPLLVNGTALLYAVSAQRAWVAVNHGDGNSTVVFSTVDGGQSWTESKPVAGGQAVAMDFAGSGQGWLLVSPGAAMGQEPVDVYSTSDGGATWSLLASGLPAECDKTGMTFTSAQVGWITSTCAGGYQVLVSRDGGEQWAATVLPLPDPACPDGCAAASLQFAGDTTVLVVSSYPAVAVLLVSTDAGESWRTETMPAGTGPYPRVTFFGSAYAIAVAAGSQGAIGPDFYLTADGGQTWTAVAQGREFGSGGASFDFLSPQLGFAWTDAGQQLYQTSDSGRTWTIVAPQLS